MRYNLIVAYDLNRGLGFEGRLSWSLPKDLKRFRQLTTQPKANVVVMGRRTWDSLPTKYRPLPNRYNLVLSRTPFGDDPPPLTYFCQSWERVDLVLESLNNDLEEVFIIGGGQIYKEAIDRYPINRYYLTEVFHKYPCDTFFPEISLWDYDLISSEMEIGQDVPNSRFRIYQRKEINQSPVNLEEQAQLNLYSDLLQRGQYRDDRTKVGTLALFETRVLRFSLRDGRFPLMTTKKVFTRGAVEELLFILSGKTNVKILQDKGVHLWDGNSSREYLDQIGQSHRAVGDLGKFYGFQLRHWGADYLDCHQDYTNIGFDQLTMVVDLIKNSPTSRRILFTMWNPKDLQETALPPCHMFYQFYVDLENRSLSCNMYMRSNDVFLGQPFNVAETALLTCLLAKTCDLKPDWISLILGDAHIYLNHLPQIREQLTRTPKPYPTLTIKTKKERLEDYTFEDLLINDYHPDPAIKAPMAV